MSMCTHRCMCFYLSVFLCQSLTSCTHPPTPPGANLSQLSDSGQTLSEDSGVDIGESGRFSKESSPRPARIRPPRHPQGAGGDTPAKPVRRTHQREERRHRERKEGDGWRVEWMDGWMNGWMMDGGSRK